MKKLLVTITIGIVGFLGWFFYVRPEPPFGAKPTPTIVVQEPTYFAEIDENGIVLRVLVINQKNIDTGKWGDPSRWIETKMDGSTRKNYAGIGYKYDSTLNAFVPPKPHPNATLNTTTASWTVPAESVASVSNE